MIQAQHEAREPEAPAKWALVLIDVINDLDFPEAKQLKPHALAMARQLAPLKKRCAELAIPVLYVNDNFGHWQSDFRRQISHCLREECQGREIAQLLLPESEDYFVLKPKHSGFFGTTLDVLLEHLDVSGLILTGMATDICVLFTANDAYMRGYQVAIPRDCVAANSLEESERALALGQKVLKADVRPWREMLAGRES